MKTYVFLTIKRLKESKIFKKELDYFLPFLPDSIDQYSVKRSAYNTKESGKEGYYIYLKDIESFDDEDFEIEIKLAESLGYK